MPQLLYVGLFVALFGSPLLLVFFTWLGFNQFSPVPRLTLWIAAVAVLVIAAANSEAWHVHLGLEWPTWQSLGLAISAAAILFVVLSAYVSVRGKFRAASPKQLELQRNLLRLPFGHRCFVVVTAAVTEEVLFRGYAIGVGQHLLGSIGLACVLSIAAFTLGHLRLGLAHLVPVFVCAFVITLLFTRTQNLWACIIVHAILDGAGILVMPALAMRRQAAQSTG
ncbi:CPBP family intramembrane glutamic endopeptidase [Dyella sp. S184]|uniref:CPBP family intramembrane glutamic endopeptidase n=1 Tax=Dyella sp. S184 TaxID=1641862 RepID=UPI00131D1584|nr:CPBP family intramembrane glutamic endopeptidase [Dyella sp. S184]